MAPYVIIEKSVVRSSKFGGSLCKKKKLGKPAKFFFLRGKTFLIYITKIKYKSRKDRHDKTEKIAEHL